MKFPISNFQFPIKTKFLFVFFGFCAILGIYSYASAATNISSISAERYAWNDVTGWIDFYGTDTVNVFNDRLEGYANSSVGFIAFNCNSTPNGNICGGAGGNWRVANDGNGNLSGFAWNDGIGWISFNCVNTGSCATSNYQTTISTTNGDFSGWAWNDNVGWISFNCNHTGDSYGLNTCGTSNYKVKTAWQTSPLGGSLISSVFDSGIVKGVAINSILWKGSLNGGMAGFQIASSNSPTGPWNFRGPGGTSLENDVYSAGPNVSMQVNLAYHNNHRYFRYKIFLYSDVGRTQTPIVQDVIINYSP